MAASTSFFTYTLFPTLEHYRTNTWRCCPVFQCTENKNAKQYALRWVSFLCTTMNGILPFDLSLSTALRNTSPLRLPLLSLGSIRMCTKASMATLCIEECALKIDCNISKGIAVIVAAAAKPQPMRCARAYLIRTINDHLAQFSIDFCQSFAVFNVYIVLRGHSKCFVSCGQQSHQRGFAGRALQFQRLASTIAR